MCQIRIKYFDITAPTRTIQDTPVYPNTYYRSLTYSHISETPVYPNTYYRSLTHSYISGTLKLNIRKPLSMQNDRFGIDGLCIIYSVSHIGDFFFLFFTLRRSLSIDITSKSYIALYFARLIIIITHILLEIYH